jgi:hypothetical protein
VSLYRTLYFVDSHYGFENAGGKKRAIHDVKAHEVMLQIASDWGPTHVICGGDGLDCGAVSHHRQKEGPRSTEGLRLADDADRYFEDIIKPLSGGKKGTRHYILGNHERWLEDVIDQVPGLEGAVSIDSLLGLSNNGWEVHPLGSALTLTGKLYYLHGDQIKGGQWPSKWAVEAYQRSVMFGHFHTSQRFTKHNALDATDIHRGFAVGCLCRRDPSYGRGAPNRWSQSIALIEEDPKSGFFQVSEVEIINGKAIFNGKVYKG